MIRPPSRIPAPGRGRRSVAVAALCLFALSMAALAPSAATQNNRRVITIADVHGAFDNFAAILQEVGLVDEALHWSGGETIFVQTGDIFDRGPDVRACLDLLMRLQEEALEQGGEVIVLFGNHEAMNLVGHWRDTTAADTDAFVDDDSDDRRDDAWEEWVDMREALAEERAEDKPRFRREAWEEAHPLGFVERMEALGPDGVYGRWLRQLPTAARVGNVLFMHAGLNPKFAELDVDEINEVVWDEVERFDATKQAMIDAGLITEHADLAEMLLSADDALGLMIRRMEESGQQPDTEGQELARELEWLLDYADWQLLSGDGLLWFRGLARWDEETHADDLDKLLEAQGVEHIVVGHTPQADAEVRSRFDGKIFLNDTGMLTEAYHGRPSALEIVDGTFTVHYLGDSRVLLSPPAGGDRLLPRARPTAGSAAPKLLLTAQATRVWIGPDGRPLPFRSDAEVLEFLRTAEIVAREALDAGKTGAQRLELRTPDVRARAIFHSVDVQREQVRIGDHFHAVFRDSWRAQVAAYELARLLAIDNVAPTVARTIDGVPGSVQLWLENEGLRSNAERVQAREYPRDVQSWMAQEWTMDIFDALIFNDDRHADNVLVDAEWNLWMIDHTRAFQSATSILGPDKLHRIDARLLAGLESLERDTISRLLDPYLEPDQISALMDRRDALIEHFNKLIDIEGEAAIVYDGRRSPRATLGDRAA